MLNMSASPHDKVAIFIDYHNLEGSLRTEGLQVDLPSLRDYLAERRRLVECLIYVGFNPNKPDEDEKFHQYLRTNGFIVRSKKAKVKPDGSLKCDLDIELTLDLVDFVSKTEIETVIIISGDGDFVPLVHWLRMRGIRVEVGCIESSMSQDLKEEASGFISLERAIEEIHGTGVERPVRREEVEIDGNGRD
jgi:uncharacterized LabA/DUF88 family protein